MSGYINSQAETLVVQAIATNVAYTGGMWSSLAAAREESGLIRSDFDMAIKALSLAGRVQMIPEENRKTITEAMRRAVIDGGDVQFHHARVI